MFVAHISKFLHFLNILLLQRSLPFRCVSIRTCYSVWAVYSLLSVYVTAIVAVVIVLQAVDGAPRATAQRHLRTNKLQVVASTSRGSESRQQTVAETRRPRNRSKPFLFCFFVEKILASVTLSCNRPITVIESSSTVRESSKLTKSLITIDTRLKLTSTTHKPAVLLLALGIPNCKFVV